MEQTITEALAEIKTINARLDKKRASVLAYLTRDSRIVDPLAKEGGSEQFVARERQAITDLEERIVRIRTAIQSANLAKTITVGGKIRTVAEWLTWRREVSQKAGQFITSMQSHILGVRGQIGQLQARGQAPTDTSVVVNLPESELASEIENFQGIVGELDGKLSLVNATVTIDA